ncbi:MAG: ATP synthase subunit I [Culicoidibacterales bacterium]
MGEVRKHVIKMYGILGALMLIGVLILVFIQKSWILGFILGGFISSLCIYLSYLSFKKVYGDKEQSNLMGAFGTLPKLLLLFLGALISYKIEVIFDTKAYILGFCMYILTFGIMAVWNFIEIRTK